MTGHPGGLATVHAGSGYGGLLRLEALACEAAETMASQLRPLIAQAVDLVVYIEANAHGLSPQLIDRITLGRRFIRPRLLISPLGFYVGFCPNPIRSTR